MRLLTITIAALALMGAVIAGPLAAEGRQEGRRGPGSGQAAPQDWDDEGPRRDDWERMTVTGEIEFTADFPVIESGGEEYSLMYPRHAAEGVELENGQTITVEGYLMPDGWWGNDEGSAGQRYLHVSTVVIDGTEYDIDRGPGMWGGRRRHHHGWGGYGPRGRGSRGGGQPRQNGGRW